MHIDNDRAMAEQLAAEVARAGGTAYYVGGFVRDTLLGKDSKDIDLEIHGITPEALETILTSLGEPVRMGASFGVFGLRRHTLDITMPRRDSRGGKDFYEAVDPFIGPEAAARRRDLTVNALMQNVLTGEVLDFFGGEADLRAGVLRHVDAETFAEDPLRVLRAAQLAARLQFTVAPETMLLCAKLPLDSLAFERVYTETEKALLKAPRPSLHFENLRAMGQLGVWYPETAALIDVIQEPKYHPEGDVWTHTMLVLDAAATLKDQAEYPAGLLFAALCHDFGKPQTTFVEGDRVRAFGHETAGLIPARAFLSRLTKEEKLRQYVLNMVEHHMKPNALAAQNAGWKATNRMFDASVSPADLLLMAKADRMGQLYPGPYDETEQWLKTRLARYRDVMAKPFVAGNDLIDAGMQPGPKFSEALAYAHRLRVSGVEKHQALGQVLAEYLPKGSI